MNGRSTPRPSRVERQAYKWVLRMLDDPAANGASLQRWLSKHPERLEIYKRVAVEVGYASDAAAELPLLRAATLRHESQPRGVWPTFFFATGLTAALVVLALLSWRTLRAGQDSSDTRAQIAMLVTRDSPKEFRLSDGSTVAMIAESQARLRFSGHERAIDLEHGRARFSVAHDPARPFTVYVRGGKVTAVGTEFEVDADRQVAVRLLKGRVIVTLPQQRDRPGNRIVELQPGQHVEFAASTGPEAKLETSAPKLQALVANRSYDDVRAAEIVDQANAVSGKKIVFADRAIGDEKIFAELNINDAEEVAKKLATILDLVIDRPALGQLRLSRKH